MADREEARDRLGAAHLRDRIPKTNYSDDQSRIRCLTVARTPSSGGPATSEAPSARESLRGRLTPTTLATASRLGCTLPRCGDQPLRSAKDRSTGRCEKAFARRLPPLPRQASGRIAIEVVSHGGGKDVKVFTLDSVSRKSAPRLDCPYSVCCGHIPNKRSHWTHQISHFSADGRQTGFSSFFYLLLRWIAQESIRSSSNRTLLARRSHSFATFER